MKTIDVLHITPEEYQKYLQVEKERAEYKFWHDQLKYQDDQFIIALKKIHSYDGDSEDALKLKEIAAKVLWDTIWGLY